MTTQRALTIVVPVAVEQKPALRALLQRAGQDPARNDLVPFGLLPGTHFGRLLILDETTDLPGAPLRPLLMLMADVDGPADAYLKRLVEVTGRGLDQLFGSCDGYPAGSPGVAERVDFLRAHLIKEGAFYANTVGRTVGQIQQEAQLREALQELLDRSRRDLDGLDALAVRNAIRRFIAGEPALRWARRPAPGLGLLERLRAKAHLLAVPLALLPFTPLLLAGAPLFAVLLRLHELTDPAPRATPDPALVARLAAIEDHAAQNQFSALGFVKPGPFRRLLANVVLFGTNYAARHVFNHANLAGVKTIHFARWVFLDDQRRVIFCSNYDGSLESYMDDFIDKVAWGLNAAFSNGYGFPKTRWLVFDGARDELAFKQFLRSHQHPTEVWFSAYPNLTALNVENNAQIRAGLYGRMTEAQAAPYVLTEEFTAVYRMHPLLPDDFAFRGTPDNRLLEECTFREIAGPATIGVLDRLSLADMLYTFGTAHPGAVSLHNFPKFLQEFERPDGKLQDLAAIDILRIRELGVPRYNEFRRLLHLRCPCPFGTPRTMKMARAGW